MLPPIAACPVRSRPGDDHHTEPVDQRPVRHPTPSDGLVPAVRRVFVGYLAAQAVLGVAWWALLAASPTVRGWFELMPGHPEVMDAWVFADIGVVVVGSAVAAVGLHLGRVWATAVLWFTAGAIVYPSIFLFGWVAFTSEGGLLLGAMVVVSLFTTWIAWQVWRAHRRTLVVPAPRAPIPR